MEIKDLIRSERLKKNLTMVELAKMIGSTHSTVSAWESGLSSPNPKYLRLLSELFGTNLTNMTEHITNDPQVHYQAATNCDKLMEAIMEMIKNNEKLIESNTKLVETNAELSKFVLESKK